MRNVEAGSLWLIKIGRNHHDIQAARECGEAIWAVCADHLKLNFPAAFAAGNLAWGFIEFQQVCTICL